MSDQTPAQPQLDLTQHLQPTTVFAVAEHFLLKQAEEAQQLGEENSGMDPTKLHILCYLAQAWHLAMVGPQLFNEACYAGPTGPFIAQLEAVTIGRDTLMPGDIRAALEDPEVIKQIDLIAKQEQDATHD